MKCVLAEQIGGVTVILANRGPLAACERPGRACRGRPPVTRHLCLARHHLSAPGALRSPGSGPRSAQDGAAPEAHRRCRCHRLRGADARRSESNLDATFGSVIARSAATRRRPFWNTAGAGAPSRRRGEDTWRFGAAAPAPGPAPALATHAGPAGRHLRGRPTNPVRRPSAKVEVSCAWWSGGVWAAVVAFAVLGTGCAPDAPRAGGDWQRAPGQQTA